MNLQAVTNTVWVFAAVNYRDEQLFAALAIAAEVRLVEELRLLKVLTGIEWPRKSGRGGGRI